MQRYKSYFLASICPTKAKKALYAGSFAILLLLIAFLQPIQRSIAGENQSFVAGGRQGYLFILFVIVAVYSQIRYLRTDEYLYLRSVELTKLMNLIIICSRVFLPAILFSCISLFPFNADVPSAIQALYTFVVFVAAASSITHAILSIEAMMIKHAKIVKVWFIAILLTALLLVLLVYPEITQSVRLIFLGAAEKHIIRPNILLLALSVVWLLILYCIDASYEPYFLHGLRRKRKISRSRVRGTLYNMVMKECVVALSKFTYLGLSALLLGIGLYCAYYGADSSVISIIGVLSAFIFSTLSEEMMAGDIKYLPLIRSLPVSLSTYYHYKILSVSIVLYLPAFAFMIFSAPFSNFSILTFIVCLILSAFLSWVWCAMQCLIVTDSASRGNDHQVMLTVSVLLSVIIPFYPIIYLLTQGDRVQKTFVKGEE